MEKHWEKGAQNTQETVEEATIYGLHVRMVKKHQLATRLFKGRS